MTSHTGRNPQPPGRPSPRRHIIRGLLVAALFAATALGGLATGALFAFADDLPAISALDDYRPSTITRVLASNGQVMGEFATERRFVIGYDQMAPALRNAVVAVEDAGFNQHVGLSMSRLVVTVVNDIITGRRAGASTITQQLARDLFLRHYRRNGIFERSLERKVREAIVAVQLEKRYTKRELFTMYANQIYLGHGAYGMEAAARLYFRKSASDLALEEAALLAAIIQQPERLSPFVNPTRARQRRNYVLQRMAEEGFIATDEATRAASLPIGTTGQPAPDRSAAPYLVEEVRKGLEQQYGATAIYEGGMTVQTTIDLELQAAVNAALDRGLRAVDKRQSPYRKPVRNLLDEGKRLDGNQVGAVTFDRWALPFHEGDVVPAVVLDTPTPRSPRGGVPIRIGPTELVMLPPGYSWAKRLTAADFRPGDLIEVRVTRLTGAVPAAVALEQPPLVEGAVLAIDNRTGQVQAMAGGLNFQRSQFNRATQARRQMGSAFKPVVYTAALDRGMTPLTQFLDEPVSYPAGPNQRPYEPLNYDRKFAGPVTLRRALEQSRNIPAVKAMLDAGPAHVVDYAKRFGFSFADSMQPYLSLALGAAEATLMELTSAYSVFPNQGVRLTPYFVGTVTDRDGTLLEEHRATPHDTISAGTAYVMTNLLRGVVERGTGAAAAQLKWPLAGKTGTMDEYTDAWFVGFDPGITIGVWIGHDEKKPLGRNETGAAAALPVWVEVMRFVIEHRRDKSNPPTFMVPAGVEFALLPTGEVEAFVAGTVPEGLALVPPPGTEAASPEAPPSSANTH
ncbi:MAG: PBP1A family penicillin-binding protein [Vicinamibacterales bacterium]|nr:PBP1A family penicillin-binding protein [Vicinamibacterales bacterium]